MVIIKGKNKLPIYSWANPEELDDGTIRQMNDLTDLPFAFHHIAIMPDAHVGFGMPIGGVLATEAYIISNAVGVDIGCGMVASRTAIKKDDFIKFRQEIANDIFNSIPLGFKKHSKPQKHEILNNLPNVPIIQKEATNIKRQLGTLGGGNHFIDALYDEDDWTWILIHSGSRNIGKKIADMYHKKAVAYTKENFQQYPTDELAALPVKSLEGQEYLTAMSFALNYAFYNRQQILMQVKRVFTKYFPNFEADMEVNIHHNYASEETHFGRKVWIHRKGATSARKDEYGVVPGSMGTCSYITRGLGNPQSYFSASHGAGRQLGRKEAKRKYSIQQVEEDLRNKDILLMSVSKAGAIEEFTKSYKDIDDVMEKQKDLSQIVYKLLPMMVIIG